MIRVERFASKLVHTVVPRQRRHGQWPKAGDHELGDIGLTGLQLDCPLVCDIVPGHGGDPGVEVHVASEIELVGYKVQVTQVLGLGREPFVPVPLVEQLLGERIAVGVTLRIEAGPRIPIPIPGTAQVIVAFEHDGVDA